MNEDFTSLAARRRKWVDANRENDFEDGIKRLLTELYPGDAHFIYELLQNAEDAGARSVRFTLYREGVRFEHDGTRLFSIEDVESITSIGVSTKRDDPTSIGKFGVGFKAVFAYTNRPLVDSGSFRFVIRDLVVPVENRTAKVPGAGKGTVFWFPFNQPRKSREEAVGEVDRGLRGLGDNTLLFLANIRVIAYSLPDGSGGSLERVTHEGGRLEIRTRHPAGEEKASHWLRFEKAVDVDDAGEHKRCQLAVAYHLEEESDKKDGAGWKVVPLHQGQVSVYFPAEKETSNLRFHVHAPFASTVARDSVRDCLGNALLRDHLASLIVESLDAIREANLLTVGFLAVLPNPQDNLPAFYEPIRQAIVRAFRDRDLTPMRKGAHAPSSTLCRGPARICEALDDDDLSSLMQRPVAWSANPPQLKQREDNFLSSLALTEWGWKELVGAMFPFHVADRRRVEAMIQEKSDDWLRRFYAVLWEAWNTVPRATPSRICDVSLVRVRMGGESDGELRHVRASNAFFPPEGEMTPPPDVPIVIPAVYRGGRSDAQKQAAQAFLSEAGIRPFDLKASIKRRLDRYPLSECGLDRRTHEDLEQFISYLAERPAEVALFQGRRFLMGRGGDGSLSWCKPAELCIDDPTSPTGLADLMAIHRKKVLFEDYAKRHSKDARKGLASFLKAIGVMHTLTVVRVSTSDNPRARELRKDYDQGRAPLTDYQVDADYWIDHLDEYLGTTSVPASQLIWEALVGAGKECGMAEFRPNAQRSIRRDESRLVARLKSVAWIPDTSGVFRKPQDMTWEDLRPGFPYDDRNGLLTAIGFGEAAKMRSATYQLRDRQARDLGFTSQEEADTVARLLRERDLSADQLVSLLPPSRGVAQPEEPVPNPERRRRGVQEDAEQAPSRESVTRERTIQVGVSPVVARGKAYLRAKYTNRDDQLVCQACRLEMPFRLPSGDYYFEAVQVVVGLDQHFHSNRLALCPTCAAKYQYARATSDDDLRQVVLDREVAQGDSWCEIDIQLAGEKHALRFVATHFLDLKTVLERSCE